MNSFATLHQAKLETLNLKGNSISSIDKETFKNLPDLLVLDISENNLTFLNKEIFSGLHECEEIFLQKNAIIEICPMTFVDLVSLKELDLTGNKLNELEKKIFPITTQFLSSTVHLKLHNNSFRCLNWLWIQIACFLQLPFICLQICVAFQVIVLKKLIFTAKTNWDWFL